MRARLLTVALLAIAPLSGLSGCAHHAAPTPEGPSRALGSEANRIR
jgi:hypothetical protein